MPMAWKLSSNVSGGGNESCRWIYIFDIAHPILDLESDVLRVQAFGRPSWFSLRVVLKGKRPAEW